MSNSNVKKRNWTFICYPESAPSNWLDILQSTGLPVSISPLHDKDINPDGTSKKAHYHLILCYPGPTTFNAVKSLTERLNAPIPLPLDSVRGMYRYFTHLDNPDKFQYSENGIKHLNGFDVSDFVELTKSEVNQIKKRLISMIVDANILEYSDLISILLDSDMSVEFDVASSNTIFFNSVISSRRHKLKGDR